MARMDQKEFTRLQGGVAIASFAAGVGIACVCLFFVAPPGEISNSAISIVSELLVLAGAILGVKTSYDAKFVKIESDLQKKADKPE
jgi:anaerobic C4-dicarboxylate transporter